MMAEEDTNRLQEAGWKAREIWEIAALTAFFNFSGRMEAASGLPQDQIPEAARLAEADER